MSENLIPLKDILDFVRPHAEKGVNGTPWCTAAEDWFVDELGVEFVKSFKKCTCGQPGCVWLAYLEGEQRFTPAENCPEFITHESLVNFVGRLTEYYRDDLADGDEEAVSLSDILDEAKSLWKL